VVAMRTVDMSGDFTIPCVPGGKYVPNPLTLRDLLEPGTQLAVVGAPFFVSHTTR